MARHNTVLARVAGICLAIALVAFAAGCGGGGGGGGEPAADTTAPTIASPSLSKSSIEPVDESLTIQATVTDNVGVASVKATITPTGGGTATTITMTGASAYTGTWSGNIAKDPGEYTVVITAKDAANNTRTSASLALTVIGGPPAPPT